MILSQLAHDSLKSPQRRVGSGSSSRPQAANVDMCGTHGFQFARAGSVLKRMWKLTLTTFQAHTSIEIDCPIHLCCVNRVRK